MTRTFEDRPATREKTPLLVGLIGPSGTGKTYSALRLATGIQRVSGGEIFVIDTEARRALHYADRFKFRHVAFGAPFGPLDYLAAIEHCVKKGAGTIFVDSMSHEHEGPGGVLEMHDAEVTRMSKGEVGKREKVKLLAWQKPKSERRRLINAILQMPVNFIFGFRAKEKLKIRPGQDPLQRGFQPIAGEEFVYEMTLKCLLLPGANGIPTWQSDIADEKMMMKLPEQFRDIFTKPQQLTEDIGQRLATWAAGGSASTTAATPPQGTPQKMTPDELVASYEAASDPATIRTLEDIRGAAWSKLAKADKERVKASSDTAKARIENAARALEAAAAAGAAAVVDQSDDDDEADDANPPLSEADDVPDDDASADALLDEAMKESA